MDCDFCHAVDSVIDSQCTKCGTAYSIVSKIKYAPWRYSDHTAKYTESDDYTESD